MTFDSVSERRELSEEGVVEGREAGS